MKALVKRQAGPGDPLQIPVHRQTRRGRDRRADEGPREDREKIADQQSPNQIPGADAVQHEKGPDHDGTRDSAAGIHDVRAAA